MNIYGNLNRRVYTLEEADNLKIPYIHWKKCRKKNEWIRTDDGWVLECLGWYQMLRDDNSPNKGNFWINTILGFASSIQKIFAVQHKIDGEVNRFLKPELSKLSGEMKIIADLIVAGYTPVDAYHKIKPNVKLPRKYVIRYFRSPCFRKYLRERYMEQYEQIMNEKGLTYDKIFEKWSEILKMKSNDPKMIEKQIEISKLSLVLHGVQVGNKTYASPNSLPPPSEGSFSNAELKELDGESEEEIQNAEMSE